MNARRFISLATVVSTVAASACRAPSPARAKQPPAPIVAKPQPPAPVGCQPRDEEWKRWFGEVFGSGAEVYHDGPDPNRLRDLTGQSRTQAEQMLRRGIAACDVFAVRAIEGAGWKSLVPELTRAVAASDASFRVHVILALKTLGSTDDFTTELIEGLGAGTFDARMNAAMGARHFSLERMRAPLLERLRRDPSWLVRNHAADSLLELADIYPRGIAQHQAIAKALQGADSKPLSDTGMLGMIDLGPPPTADDLASFARAAEQLDRAITERLAAGTCPKAAPVSRVALHTVRVNAGVVALAVEDSVGPCERTLAFVVFVHSPGGFSESGDMVGRDRVKMSLQSEPKALTVEYARATRKLIVGSFTLDTTKANVALLSTGPSGVAARHQASENLTFERHGGPSSSPMEAMGLSPEVPAAVRALVDRSPELAKVIAAVSR